MIIWEFDYFADKLEDNYSSTNLLTRAIFFVVFFLLILKFLFKDNMNSF